MSEAGANSIPSGVPILRTFDVRGRERHWRTDKKRKFQIERAFRALGFYRRADRMDNCGRLLDFDHHRLANGESLYTVAIANNCRERQCPQCQKLLASKRHYQLCNLVGAHLAESPSDQALLLSVTTKNCEASQLIHSLNHQQSSFRKMTRRQRFTKAIRAWYRTLEITRNASTGQFHPHIHALLLVPASYFQRKRGLYIDQRAREWTHLWRDCLGVDYEPVVDVRAVAGVGGGHLGDQGRTSLLELTKYVTKPSDLVPLVDGEPQAVDCELLLTLHKALRGRRLVGMSKGFRERAAELGHVDFDDDDADWSVATRLPEDAVYVGRERFEWNPTLREYVLRVRFIKPNAGRLNDYESVWGGAAPS